MMKINLKHSYFIFFLILLGYFSISFFITKPFWGLMDDATSIKTAIQYSIDPIETTREWVSHHNKNGMFRPFFATQQYIQFLFYDFSNPYPTFLLNIFIVIIGIYLFSKVFVAQKNLILFYSIYILWPYTYDWLFLPSLNSKWGLIFSCIALLMKNSRKLTPLKFLLGTFAVLMKLDVVVLLPLAFYQETKQQNPKTVTSGMGLGFFIQMFFFFSYPNSYYNTGIFETIKNINFFTLQNLIIGLVILLSLFDLYFIKQSKENKLKIICCLVSILIAVGILNLRNSNYAYLGAILIFPILIYTISFIERIEPFKKIFSDFEIILIVVCLLVSNIFLLNPRLERWNDLEKIVNLEFQEQAVYFCEEGQKMINVWDIENNNPEISFFSTFLYEYENIYIWIDEYKNEFRFSEYDLEKINSHNYLYLIDPFCDESLNFLANDLKNCDIEFLYNNELKLIEKKC